MEHFLCAKSTSKCENARVGCVWERKRDSECHVSFMERVSERERERERERIGMRKRDGHYLTSM